MRACLARMSNRPSMSWSWICGDGLFTGSGSAESAFSWERAFIVRAHNCGVYFRRISNDICRLMKEEYGGGGRGESYQTLKGMGLEQNGQINV